MNILAFEFSSPRRSVAVVEQCPGSSPRGLGAAVEAGELNAKPFALIEAALDKAGLEREQVDCVAVGLGPGSYTGIRIAIAIAQGWQLARGVKLLGISTVDCLAAQLAAEGFQGQATMVIDAQRNEFYLAAYEFGANSCRCLEPLRLAPQDEVQSLVQKGVRLCGPEVIQRFPQARDLFPDAAALGTLAAQRSDFLPGEKLEPIYLRPTAFVKAPPPRFAG
jgi:tRNA threonylcarbamoyl adenosine modification protein YeaZ